MISKEDVISAYRLILGREPENTDVVENYSQTIHSPKDLRAEFLKSPEFVEEMTLALKSPQFVRQRHPFNFPKIPVEVRVSEEKLNMMFRRIADVWERLGFTEPYWSVLTQPQYKVQDFSNNSEQFYESGGPLFRNFISTLKRNGFNPAMIENCAEIGCGVGRMTGYLAETFSRVIAIDVSSQHLVKAKNYLDSKGIHNVELVHWKNFTDVEQLSNIDLILSVITLQHNPPPVSAWLILKLLGSLKPGGVAFIQIPTYRNGYFFEVERYLNRSNTTEIEMHFLPQNEVFRIVEEAGCRCIEVREDGMVGEESLTLSNSFLIQKNI